MITKKEKIWRLILMVPWLFLMVLYFIWANQHGFNIKKNTFGIVLATITSVFWYAIACLFAEVFAGDE